MVSDGPRKERRQTMNLVEKTYSASQKRINKLSKEILLILADNNATVAEIITTLAKSSVLGIFFAAQKEKVSPGEFYLVFMKAMIDMYREEETELSSKLKLMEMAKEGGAQGKRLSFIWARKPQQPLKQCSTLVISMSAPSVFRPSRTSLSTSGAMLATSSPRPPSPSSTPCAPCVRTSAHSSPR